MEVLGGSGVKGLIQAASWNMYLEALRLAGHRLGTLCMWVIAEAMRMDADVKAGHSARKGRGRDGTEPSR